VRLYQSKGLLPGPVLVGRTGYYDDAHLTRLRLIGRLQSQGFSLAGIARLLDSWERGLDLAEVVQAGDQLDAVLGRPQPVALDPEELVSRFPPGTLTPEVMQRALALGLVEATDDGRFRTTDRRFIDTGAELAALGVPPMVILDEWERLVGMTDEVADRFVDVFERHLLPDDWRRLDRDQAVALLETLRRIRKVATQVVAAAVDTSIDRTAARRLADLFDPPAAPSPPPPGPPGLRFEGRP
jgi:DNA-binding transcriptional MerR regulator